MLFLFLLFLIGGEFFWYFVSRVFSYEVYLFSIHDFLDNPGLLISSVGQVAVDDLLGDLRVVGLLDRIC